MKQYSIFAFLLLCAAILSSLDLYALSEQPGWTSYVSSQESETAWSKTVRGIGRGASGLGALKEGGWDNDFQRLVSAVNGMDSKLELILPLGIIGSGRKEEDVGHYISLVEFDDGLRVRQFIGRQVLEIAQKGSPRKIYWQIGNEINSWHFAENILPWAESHPAPKNDPYVELLTAGKTDDDGVAGLPETLASAINFPKKLGRNNMDVIPLYAEYVFAPAVMAINDIEARYPQYKGQLNIVLGSLANSRNSKARDWLKRLLNYTIEGKYAPALAGKRVRKLIDVIAVHYLMSSKAADWERNLRSLYAETLDGEDTIALWATEEVGRRAAKKGLGSVRAFKVWARYMHYYLENGISPDIGRFNYWGWKHGPGSTTSDTVLATLVNYLGTQRLDVVPVTSLLQLAPDDLEIYSFENSKGVRLTGIFPTSTLLGTRIERINLGRASRRMLKTDLFLYDLSGSKTIAFESEVIDGEQILLPVEKLIIKPDQAIMIVSANE